MVAHAAALAVNHLTGWSGMLLLDAFLNVIMAIVLVYHENVVPVVALGNFTMAGV